MASLRSDATDPVKAASQFSVEVAAHSHLVFSSLKQFNEVVFWERPNLPEIPPSDLDSFFPMQIQDRIDNMANDFYADPLFWWALAAANNVGLPPLQMNPGFKFRYPSAVSLLASIRSGPSQP
jgi:hypothetical protein